MYLGSLPTAVMHVRGTQFLLIVGCCMGRELHLSNTEFGQLLAATWRKVGVACIASQLQDAGERRDVVALYGRPSDLPAVNVHNTDCPGASASDHVVIEVKGDGGGEDSHMMISMQIRGSAVPPLSWTFDIFLRPSSHSKAATFLLERYGTPTPAPLRGKLRMCNATTPSTPKSWQWSRPMPPAHQLVSTPAWHSPAEHEHKVEEGGSGGGVGGEKLGSGFVRDSVAMAQAWADAHEVFSKDEEVDAGEEVDDIHDEDEDEDEDEHYQPTSPTFPHTSDSFVAPDMSGHRSWPFMSTATKGAASRGDFASAPAKLHVPTTTIIAFPHD